MTAWFRKTEAAPARASAAIDPAAAAETLRAFIAGKSKIVQASELTNETKLFSSGLLDSLAFVELVLFVDKEFRLKLAEVTDVNMESLDSIQQILAPILARAAGR